MGFAGTPYPVGTGLPMAQRSLSTQIVRKFRGLNRYSNVTNVPGDWAIDLLNVIVNGTGGIAKMRLPHPLTAVHTVAGPDRFFDFQQANGTRQIFANFGNELAWFDVNAAYAFHTIETAAGNAPTWDWATANNILFGANAQRMVKWTGAVLQNWGGAGPVAFDPWNPPQFPGIVASLQRNANVVTAVLTDPADLGTTSAACVILISSPNDASFNGHFAIATFTDQTHVTWNQVGANSGVVVGARYLPLSQTAHYVIAGGAAVRVAGVTTITITASSGDAVALGANFVASARALRVSITGVADASFNGTFDVISKAGNVITFAQSGAPDATSGGGSVDGTLLAPSPGGYSYAYSWKNSITGHVTNRSPVGVNLGTDTRPVTYTLFATAPADPQFDTVVWWRTLNGGSNWYYVTEIPIATSLKFVDTWADALLDQTQQAPLINNPPIQGRFLSVWGGRVFVFNLIGSPQDIIYSGYEKILVGRPEESFPPGNRLRLSIGADALAGGGAIQAGIIAFSKSAKMYMFRGIAEDISVSTPLLFSSYLEELPWQIGCLSHYAIASTPYGLIWLASDRTVMQYDGTSKPVCLSAPIHPMLKSITVGREGQCRASYFNWLDKDWYALTCPINNSAVNNAIFFFDLEPEPELNSGIFYSNIEADDIRVIEDANGQRQLCISSGGVISNLQVEVNTVNGIDIAPRAPTGGVLTAFWQSGYYGNETPQMRRMFRTCRYIADAAGFAITANFVDDENYTFQAPFVKNLAIRAGNRALLDRKARRCSLKINFPAADADADLVELLVHSIATSER